MKCLYRSTVWTLGLQSVAQLSESVGTFGWQVTGVGDWRSEVKLESSFKLNLSVSWISVDLWKKPSPM